jgi:hypothetical protein
LLRTSFNRNRWSLVIRAFVHKQKAPASFQKFFFLSSSSSSSSSSTTTPSNLQHNFIKAYSNTNTKQIHHGFRPQGPVRQYVALHQAPHSRTHADNITEVGEKVTPDSSKSTIDKVKESVTDAGDKVAR